MPYASLDAALGEVGRRLDVQRQGLYYLDSAVLRVSARVTELARETRAMAYVAASAGLESLVTAVIDGVVTEVAACACPLSQLRLSLFAIVCEPELEALRVLGRGRLWERRCSMFERVADADTPFTDTAIRPLDGRTLRATHFATIWRVFGFTGSSLPGGIHGGALEDLATNRNDVAHGMVNPQTIGRRKTVDDVLRMLQRVEEIGIHLYLAAEEYLDRQGYRR